MGVGVRHGLENKSVFFLVYYLLYNLWSQFLFSCIVLFDRLPYLVG